MPRLLPLSFLVNQNQRALRVQLRDLCAFLKCRRVRVYKIAGKVF